MDTYAHGYGSTGHYARPGTHTSYCGRELQHTPNTGIAARICKACTKAEAADRAAAEQVAADRVEDGPSLAERAGVTLAMVGRGNRPHYADGDKTLCHRPLDSDHRAEAAALRVRGDWPVCVPCTRAAEQRAYARSLATASPLAAAAVELAETVEQADAEREQAAPAVRRFYSTGEAYDATQCRDEIKDGDVLIIERERVVGFLRRAWPGAITAEHGELHTFAADPRTIDDGRYALSVQYAEQIARDLEYPLAGEEVAPQPTTEQPASAMYCTLHGSRCDGDVRTLHHMRPMTPAEVERRLDRVEAEESARFTAAARAVEHAEQTAAAVDTVAEAETLYAVQLVTEADATDGTWRGEWIGAQPDGDALFPIERPAEQGALFADRATVEQAHEGRVVEGVIVAHAGTAEGSAPKDAGHPDVIAARAALRPLKPAALTDRHDFAEPDEDALDVRGFVIDPRGHGRVALYWLEGGRAVRRDDAWHGKCVDFLADKIRQAGWQTEKMLRSSLCVFAHRPAE